VLKLKNVWVRYGKKAAVRNLSLSVDKGGFVTILGANGAGKTTTLNAISGIVQVEKDHGEILFNGRKINGLKPGEIAAMGIIQIPEGRKLFPLMTVKENLLIGAYLRNDKREVQKSMDKVLTLYPILKDKLNAQSRALSGGQQQMVAIGRGLMANPELLLLDEPSLGLSPLLRQQLAETIKEIHSLGVTIVLVEQNARLGLLLASYGYVLENGELSLEGKTADLMLDESVKKAYLGV
jgi:branched-chain amino acid transport system ATP-binding protein